MEPAGITVNSVALDVILTAIRERTNTPETLEALRLTTTAKRLGQPVDCASAVLFLASEAASFITGSTVAVNGGMRMDLNRAATPLLVGIVVERRRPTSPNVTTTVAHHGNYTHVRKTQLDSR